MHEDRVKELAEEVYNFVFELLDIKDDVEGLSGMEAGEVATCCERAFVKQINKIQGIEDTED